TQDRVWIHLPSPCQRSDSRHQYLEGERFGQIIVRSSVQARTDVVRRIAGGQQENRRTDPFVSKFSDDRNAVRALQHDVHHKDVEFANLCSLQSLSAVEGESRGVSGFVHTLLKLTGELSVVLDNQDAHLSEYQYRRSI